MTRTFDYNVIEQISFILEKYGGPLLRGNTDNRLNPNKRPVDKVNLKINVLIPTLTRGHPSCKATFQGQKGWPHKRGSTVYTILKKFPAVYYTENNTFPIDRLFYENT